jgi:hypothetical protein
MNQNQKYITGMLRPVILNVSRNAPLTTLILMVRYGAEKKLSVSGRVC